MYKNFPNYLYRYDEKIEILIKKMINISIFLIEWFIGLFSFFNIREIPFILNLF